MVKKISDNEIYFLIKYIKNVLWRVVKRLSYIQDARCLKVKKKTELRVSENRVLTNLFDLRGMKYQENGEDFVMRSFIICVLQLVV